MKKWIFLGVGLFTLLAVLWALPYLVDMESTKRRVLPILGQTLNRSVEIGTLRLMVFPAPGLRAEGVTLHEDPSFPGDVFAYADTVDVHLRLLPLLRGRVDISSVILQRPSILIAKNESGVLNLSTLGGAAKAPAAGAEKKDRAGGFLRSFSLRSLTIRQGALSYSDATSGESPPSVFSIEDIDASVHNLVLGGMLDADVVFRKKSEAVRVRFEGQAGPLDADGMPAGAHGTLFIEKNALTFEAHREEGGLRFQASSDNLIPANVFALLPGGKSSLPPGLDLKGAASFRIQGEARGGVSAGEISSVLDALEVDYAGRFTKPKGIPLSFGAKFSGNGASMDVSDLSVTLSTVRLTGAGRFSRAGKPNLSGKFGSNSFDLEPWSALVPAIREKGLGGRAKVSGTFERQTPASLLTYAIDIDLDDVHAKISPLPKELREMRGSVRLIPGGAVLRNLFFKSGGSDVSLSGEIRNFDAPVGEVSIASSVIDPGDFKAAESGTSSAPEKKGKERKGGPLSKAAIRADLDLKKVALPRMPVENVKGTLIADGGKIHLDGLSFTAADGIVRANGTAELWGDKPAFDLSTRLEHVAIKNLFKEFTSAGDTIEGGADADLKFKGRGADWEEISKTLSGGGTLSIKNGMIRRSNLLAEGLGLIMSGPLAVSQFLGISRDKMPMDTTFKTWDTTLSFSGGRLSLSDIKLVAADFTLTGSGAVGLDKTLDFRTQIRLGSSLGRGLTHLPVTNFLVDNQGQAVIPMKVTGTLSSPRYLPDASYVREHAVYHIKEKTLNFLKGVVPGAEPTSKATPGVEQPTPKPQQIPNLKDLFRGLGR